MAFKLSARAKRVLVGVAVTYLAAALVMLFLVVRNRDVVTLPRLLEKEIALPAARAEDEPFLASLEAARYRAAEDVGAIVKEHALLTADVLAKLAAAGRTPLRVLDPIVVRAFAGRDLKSAGDVAAGDGALIVAAGDALDEAAVTRLLLERPDLAGKRLAVKGRGGLIQVNMTFLFAWLNYLAFVVVLGAVLWGPVTKALDARAAEIRGNIDGASNARAEAEKLRDTYANVVDETRKRMDGMLEESRQEGLAERDRIVRAAQEEAARETDRGRAELASEAERARRALLREVAGLSGDLAGRVLGREVKPSDHEQLVDAFLAEVEKGED